MRNLSRLLDLGPLGLSALATCFFTLAACSDSLHLDPEPTPGTGGSTGAGGFGGAGGSGPIPCKTSSECPAPMAVCDTEKGECVECLEVSDCLFRPGTVCSMGTCACPTEGESFCGALGQAPARCVDLSASSDDCGQCGHACFGACNMGQCADPWEPTSLVDAPAARYRHNAVWTGTKMIVWGGATSANGSTLTNTGGIYDLSSGEWTATSTANAPSPRQLAAAVWTGSRMIVWGGEGGGALGDGGIYDPVTNTWKAVNKNGAPSPRYQHAAVWTGSKMVIWGGFDGAYLGDGAVYDPMTDAWTAVNGSGAPLARREHVAVWADGAGARMLVFGGYGFDPGLPGDKYFNDGGAYDPATETWVPLAAAGTPSGRVGHTAVWTGSDMPVWGGYDGGQLGTGAEYNLVSTTWSLMNDPSPAPRSYHTAVWIGDPVRKMVMWGGDNGSVLGSGSMYNPVTNLWDEEMPTAPAARSHHTAVVAGSRMIIWGGRTPGLTNTGGVFNAAAQ